MENFTKIELIESDELMANVAMLEDFSAEMASEEEWMAEYKEYLDEYPHY